VRATHDRACDVDPAWEPPEWDLVVRWRRERLLAAGFDAEDATVLAVTRDVDLHALLALVDRGCPPQLACRILDPTLPREETR
jgi:hypothetical protein